MPDPRRRYRIYGLTVESVVSFVCPLPQAGDRESDVVLSLEEGCPPAATLDGTAVYDSEEWEPGIVPRVVVRRGPSGDAIRFVGHADFVCSDQRVHAFPAAGAGRETVEMFFLGPVLSFLLERRGVPVLHGAALDVGGRAVALIGRNRSGKSSLALALVAGGNALISDDVLPVDGGPDGPAVRPAFPSMRLWPDSVRGLTDLAPEALPRVHPSFDKRRLGVGDGFGRFCCEARPLAAVYLLARSDADGGDGVAAFEQVPPGQAVVELLTRSFLPRLAAAAGWQPRRLAALGRLVERVPVRRLTYPSGYERLGEVTEAIERDVAGTG